VVKNKLKEILKERGIKQTWLAEKIGISHKTLSNIILNKYNTSLEVGLNISKMLNTPVESIFYIE